MDDQQWADESTRVDTPTPKVRVRREIGVCGVCSLAGGQVIEAFDQRVYKGWACPDCVLSGRASEFSPDHPVMRPIVFVARGIRGDQPFKDLLKAADIQRGDPQHQSKRAEAVASFLKMNRHQRRATLKRARKKGKS